jgi:hypothetical protein
LITKQVTALPVLKAYVVLEINASVKEKLEAITCANPKLLLMIAQLSEQIPMEFAELSVGPLLNVTEPYHQW